MMRQAGREDSPGVADALVRELNSKLAQTRVERGKNGLLRMSTSPGNVSRSEVEFRKVLGKAIGAKGTIDLTAVRDKPDVTVDSGVGKNRGQIDLADVHNLATHPSRPNLAPSALGLVGHAIEEEFHIQLEKQSFMPAHNAALNAEANIEGFRRDPATDFYSSPKDDQYMWHYKSTWQSSPGEYRFGWGVSKTGNHDVHLLGSGFAIP